MISVRVSTLDVWLYFMTAMIFCKLQFVYTALHILDVKWFKLTYYLDKYVTKKYKLWLRLVKRL